MTMLSTSRPQREKTFLLAVSVVAAGMVIASALTGLMLTRRMKLAVIRQFNEEQLVIARFVRQHIEDQIDSISQEMVRLAKETGGLDKDATQQEKTINGALTRYLDAGLKQVEIVDAEKAERRIHTIHYVRSAAWRPRPDETVSRIDDPASRGTVWLGPTNVESNEVLMTLGVSVDHPKRSQILFRVNVTRLLDRYLKTVRSGKTGYAWVIDEKGTFLYHPNKPFIGDNAFSIRLKTFPYGLFDRINAIQKEMMATGVEGTGSYTSYWHRGITGKIRKLIAYCPVLLADSPSRRWHVAVVAPVAEIEAAIGDTSRLQLAAQAIILLVLASGATLIIVLERRWSRRLEETVIQRTDAYRRSEERYRALVESAEDFIFTVDREGYFQSVNTFTANFFGGSPEDFTGRHLSELFEPTLAEKHIQLIRLVSDVGKSIRDEVELKIGNHAIWLNANYMPLKQMGDTVIDILCIARDITDEKNLEKQLINTEKLASLGTLAAGVAHEVNNPLGVMLGFCDLLLQKADPDSQMYQDLMTIERQGMHCRNVIENLLSFSRDSKESADHADVNACLDEIVNVVRHTLDMRGITLALDRAADLPAVHGGPRQIQQVFLNLINNAIAAMPHGGSMAIRSRLNRRDRMVAIVFSDSGTGIDPEHLDRIFEPFFTTKPEGEGTGLGLFVSYGIVAKYGGALSCVSPASSDHGSDGGSPGATFTVRLPIWQGEG